MPLPNSLLAAVLCPVLKGDITEKRFPEHRLEEAVRLAQAIDLTVVFQQCYNLSRYRPSHLLGEGVVEELHALVEEQKITVVIVDATVSPVQQRNLERALGCKVIDRTGLILEIFGKRAQTFEGKLQVELAALSYQKSRLVRSWTHLERQRGGFGFLGGPGESQIELDRRIIGDRITKIKKDLEGVKRTRGIQRGARQKVPYPVVALVGYTNAGKSTLFNALSNATVLAKDMLFATLDPTMRAITLPSGQKIIASDTVGFISHLPTTLVTAFRATLEEVLAADVILHVRDIAHLETEQQKQDVLAILRDIGIDEEILEHRLIEVWNKSDLLPIAAKKALNAKAKNAAFCIAVSAQTGEGITALSEAIEQRCTENWHTLTVNIPHDNGAAFAWLHQHGKILKSTAYQKHTRLTVQLSPQNLKRWESGVENS